VLFDIKKKSVYLSNTTLNQSIYKLYYFIVESITILIVPLVCIIVVENNYYALHVSFSHVLISIYFFNVEFLIGQT